MEFKTSFESQIFCLVSFETKGFDGRQFAGKRLERYPLSRLLSRDLGDCESSFCRVRRVEFTTEMSALE